MSIEHDASTSDGSNFRLVVDIARVRSALVMVCSALEEQHGGYLTVHEDLHWQSLAAQPATACASSGELRWD